MIKRMMALAGLAVAPWALAQGNESAAYAACMDTAQTTPSVIECNNEEIARQDMRLNQAFARAMGALGAVQQGKLSDAQRLWVTYRDSNCDLYYSLTGTSGDMFAGGGCRLSMTTARADELEALQLP